MGKRGHRLRSGIISYGFLILGSVVMLVPFIWMILTSFKTYAEAVRIPVVWLPAEWNLDNYRDVLLRLDFLQYYKNTIIVTLLVTTIMLFIGSLSAFAFARMSSGTDDNDSQISDHQQAGMGGYHMGACDPEHFQRVYHVHAQTVFCGAAERIGGCGENRRMLLVPAVLEY